MLTIVFNKYSKRGVANMNKKRKYCDLLLSLFILISFFEIKVKNQYPSFSQATLYANDGSLDTELDLLLVPPTTHSAAPHALEGLFNAPLIAITNDRHTAEDGEVDQPSLENAIQAHLSTRRKGAKNLRFALGAIAGTTTGGGAKILGGITLFLSSLSNLDNPISYSACQSGAIVTINATTSWEEMVARQYIIDFSNTRNYSTAVNTSNHSVWFLDASRICSKQSIPTLQASYIIGIISGVVLVASGIFDLILAVNPFAFNGGSLFEKYIVQAFQIREKNKKGILKNQINDFLRFADGEFVDLYQKRGSFNAAKFVSALVKW